MVGKSGLDTQNVLILGDNHISSSIAQSLLQLHYNVTIALSGNPERAHRDPGITYTHCDFTATNLQRLLQEVNPSTLISTISGGSYDLQKRIIDCAVQASIPRFIPHEFGHDSLNAKLHQRLPPSAERARVIQYLCSLSASRKLTWCAIATGTDLTHGLQSGNLGFDLAWHSATVHGQGCERFAASSSAWYGRAVAAVLEHWDDVRNEYLYLAGLTTCADEIVACLKLATGHEWEVGSVELEDTLREAEHRLQRGFPDAAVFLFERSVLYDEDLGASLPFERADARRRLQLDGERIEDVVQSIVHRHNEHGKADCGCG